MNIFGSHFHIKSVPFCVVEFWTIGCPRTSSELTVNTHSRAGQGELLVSSYTSNKGTHTHPQLYLRLLASSAHPCSVPSMASPRSQYDRSEHVEGRAWEAQGERADEEMPEHSGHRCGLESGWKAALRESRVATKTHGGR